MRVKANSSFCIDIEVTFLSRTIPHTHCCIHSFSQCICKRMYVWYVCAVSECSINIVSHTNSYVWVLRSAVGMTRSLRSDLWWTIPFRVLLGHFGIPFGSLTIRSTLARHFGESLVNRLYSEIDQTYLSIEAQCVSDYYPRWTATPQECLCECFWSVPIKVNM